MGIEIFDYTTMADLNLDDIQDFGNRQLYESEMALRVTMNTVGIGLR